MDYAKLSDKKKRLDKHRPLSKELVRNLDDWFRIELTYTSNAIEGNTLTRQETAMVVEKGLTVGGKTLVEHLEATNHAHAIDWVKDQIKKKPTKITVNDILTIHNLILKGIDDDNAGHYRRFRVRISGSTVVLPNPQKIPDLMTDFIDWLKGTDSLHPVELAAQAHYRLVTIHPFADGNGRSARLLMNMILLINGYPAAIIRKQDRLNYINSLEKAQLSGSQDDYLTLTAKAVDRSLTIYLKSIDGTEETPKDQSALLKIGELAKQSGENNSTLRHWTKEGLLEVAETTASGYQLYSTHMVEQIKKINALKKKRYSLKEIKKLIK
jgi:Fic family protein